MTYYPQSASGLAYKTYPVGPTTVGLLLTSNATANIKGAYAELVPSLDFTCNYILVKIIGTFIAAGRLFLIDIAKGAAGAEVIIISNISAEGNSTGSSVFGHGLYLIPCKIEAGARVSMRCQCNTGGNTIGQVAITFIAAGGVEGIPTFTTYGANTADSGGTAIDPGATANIKGAWVQMIASTSAIIQWLGLITTYGHAGVNTAGWAIDIGIGAAGAEVVLIPDIRISSATSAGASPDIQPRLTPFLTYIPAGSRIAIRTSCSITTAGDRLIDTVLLVGTAPVESGGSGGGTHAATFCG